MSASNRNLLALAVQMNSIANSAQNSGPFNDEEKKLLLDKAATITAASATLSVILNASVRDKNDLKVSFASISSILSAAFEIGSLTHITPTIRRHTISSINKKARDDRALKRDGRAKILDGQLALLLSKGIGGENLRTRLIALFKQAGVPKSLSEPSASTVYTWARNFRRTGDWRKAG